jgi:hypothetical protein
LLPDTKKRVVGIETNLIIIIMNSSYKPKKNATKRAGKLLKKKDLTKRQKETMKKHSPHHTDKHMSVMRSAMLGGKTFGEAHKEAMKKVGK